MSALDELKIDRAAPAPTGRWPGVIALGLALVLLIVGGLWFWKSRSKAVPVQTMVVKETISASASPTTVLNASGYVTPRREATVSSKVTGKVVEVNIEEGMRVKADQILARLDDTNIRASLNLAQAQLEAAKSALGETVARLDEAKKEHIRVTKLAANKIAAEAELDKAQAEVNSLQARLSLQEVEVTVADRQLALWHQQLDDTIIRAPFAGVITAKNAQPGEMISPISAGGGFTRTGICTIVDMDSLEIEVDVNESYINRVESGQYVEATLDSYPNWKIPAKVIAIIPTADRQKATVKVRVGFEKLDPRILPQMGVKVAFRGGNPDARVGAARQTRIPKTALRREGERDVVFVVQNGRVERRAVTLSPDTRVGVAEDEVFVQAGLSDGERVIVAGPQMLAEGVRVKESKQ